MSTSQKFGRKWAGRIYGTNTGNVYLELKDDQPEAKGILRVLDDRYGISIFSVVAFEEGDTLRIRGEPDLEKSEAAGLSNFTASATLGSRGELRGDWETDYGTGGTVELFPHDVRGGSTDHQVSSPPQFFSRKILLGPVEIDRAGLEKIAGSLREDFPTSEVIVTVNQGTELSTYLPQFKKLEFSSQGATFAKMFVQTAEGNGLNRSVTIEFGQVENLVLAQSGDESVAIGLAEKYHQRTRVYQRAYALNFKRFGVGINQFLFVGMLIFLPNITNTAQRALYVFAIVGIIMLFTFLHQRYIPNAAISLGPSPPSPLVQGGAKALSWLLGLVTTVTAGVVTAEIDAIWSFLAGLVEP